MYPVMRSSFLPYGCLFNSSSFGWSVANAKLANVSIIRFTQSICEDDNGDSCKVIDPMRLTSTPTTFTVSWKTKNFRIPSRMFRPQELGCFMIQKENQNQCNFALILVLLPWSHDGSIVIIEENNITSFFDDLRAVLAHCETHIGHLEARCIICAISSHCNNFPLWFESLHEL